MEDIHPKGTHSDEVNEASHEVYSSQDYTDDTSVTDADASSYPLSYQDSLTTEADVDLEFTPEESREEISTTRLPTSHESTLADYAYDDDGVTYVTDERFDPMERAAVAEIP